MLPFFGTSFLFAIKISLNNSGKIEKRIRSQIKYGKYKIFNFRLKTREELISPAQSSTHGNHLSRRIGVEVEEPHLFASANPATNHTIPYDTNETHGSNVEFACLLGTYACTYQNIE